MGCIYIDTSPRLRLPGHRLALGGCLSHQRQERKPLFGSLSSKEVGNNYKTLGLSLSKQLGNILIWLLSKRVALKWSWLLSGQRSRVAVADKSCWGWVAHVGLMKAGSCFLCVCLQISIIKAIYIYIYMYIWGNFGWKTAEAGWQAYRDVLLLKYSPPSMSV